MLEDLAFWWSELLDSEEGFGVAGAWWWTGAVWDEGRGGGDEDDGAATGEDCSWGVSRGRRGLRGVVVVVVAVVWVVMGMEQGLLGVLGGLLGAVAGRTAAETWECGVVPPFAVICCCEICPSPTTPASRDITAIRDPGATAARPAAFAAVEPTAAACGDAEEATTAVLVAVAAACTCTASLGGVVEEDGAFDTPALAGAALAGSGDALRVLRRYLFMEAAAREGGWGCWGERGMGSWRRGPLVLAEVGVSGGLDRDHIGWLVEQQGGRRGRKKAGGEEKEVWRCSVRCLALSGAAAGTRRPRQSIHVGNPHPSTGPLCTGPQHRPCHWPNIINFILFQGYSHTSITASA